MKPCYNCGWTNFENDVRCAKCNATNWFIKPGEVDKVMNPRNGLPEFYKLLEEAAITHDKKSHDYASNANPLGNYNFAGHLARLFKDDTDAGLIGRFGEKLYRLSNLEADSKVAVNESIEDTETDMLVIVGLFVANRRKRRAESK